ncbi:hypothetical protein ABOM_012144 [Aspergillus bombycis]|uniref:C2H2-type domain-containing protein n=1 Tax=Aspergillus bombycis TaxID=109264 RepID=A0A1F7ZIX8_9EURO|nr:hypothetical protein ABOM_012144 [Aspergillus bombycis]OGM39393.1 hypothetical protein ABOM_012144 [Aspergillus bombycis]
MASLQRQLDTLLKIVKQTSKRFICPECLQGFPRSEVLYCHFRKQKDNIHQGLDMRNTDYKTFLLCYQKALKASIPAEKLPQGPQCFALAYIVEHYEEDAETHQHLIPNSASHNQTANSLFDAGPSSSALPSDYLPQGAILDESTVWNNWGNVSPGFEDGFN